MSFHNTNDEFGDELARSESRAATQEQMVLDFYMRNADVPYAAHEVHAQVFDLRVPLTSTRRCISDLARDGLLQKTGVCVPGAYGKPVSTWATASAAKVLGANWEGV